MSAGHTPGPWRMADDGVVMFSPTGFWKDARAVRVASGFIEDAWCGGDGDAETRANACLMAAAPTMLEALQEALRQIEKYAEFFCEEDFDITVDQLRSAIARATGAA